MSTQPSTTTPYPGPTTEDLAKIPADLKARPQWVLFRLEEIISKKTGEAKLTKIPIDPQTLYNASTTRLETWGTFEQCVAALPRALDDWGRNAPSDYRGAGLGFVLTAADDDLLVDLDHSVDPDTGIIADWARAIVETLQSYTQRSVSRQGLHVLVKGKVPPGRKQHGALQMWDCERFCAMTGWHLPGTPLTIEARQGQLTMVHAAYILKPKAEAKAAKQQTKRAPRSTLSRSPRLSDAAILAKAGEAQNRDKFLRLWAGDWSGYDSQSEGDEALCCLLAFYTRDADQIESLFRQSGLYRESKWSDRDDYRERTITHALDQGTAQYDPAAYAAERDGRQRRNGQATPAPAAPDETALQAPALDGLQRLTIQITTEITDIVDKGQVALLALPEAPVLFQRARRLCIIARGVPPPKWLHRPQDAPVILEASPARLCELVAQAARWEKYDARKKGWVSVLPPKWFVETLQGRPSWPFPVLEGIIGAPTLRPDGSLLDIPGYDVSTGLWYDSNGTHYPALADNPTRDDARNAVNDLYDVLQNFPFVGSGKAAALAAILSVVCRFAVQGGVPLFAVRSTIRGSGKGLLVDVCSMIGTGRPAPRWPQSDNDEEDRKRLLTVAMAGDATMHIDNVVKALGSPSLDLALTAPSVSDRILGKSAKVEAPLTMVWFASGNNMQFKGDTVRRVVPIDLDPQMERPEERTNFVYPKLLDHVHRVRPALVSAALTMVHAYFQASTPTQGLTAYGSFEAWSDIIRSAVVWAADADPCEGRTTLEAESDPAFDSLTSLLHCWEACFENNEATLVSARKEIQRWAQPIDTNNPANKWHDLQAALSVFDPTYRGQALNVEVIGNQFRKLRGRVVHDKRLMRGEKRQETGWGWKVVSCSSVASVALPRHARESVSSTKPEGEGESMTYSKMREVTPTGPTGPTGTHPTQSPLGGPHDWIKVPRGWVCARCNTNDFGDVQCNVAVPSDEDDAVPFPHAERTQYAPKHVYP